MAPGADRGSPHAAPPPGLGSDCGRGLLPAAAAAPQPRPERRYVPAEASPHVILWSGGLNPHTRGLERAAKPRCCSWKSDEEEGKLFLSAPNPNESRLRYQTIS